jgi:hypothetical protein
LTAVGTSSKRPCMSTPIPKLAAEATLIVPDEATQREVMNLYNKVDHLSRHADIPTIRAGNGRPQDETKWQGRHARARSGTDGVVPKTGVASR